MTSPRAALCPECDRMIVLKADGTYRRHLKRDANYTCPASGTTPPSDSGEVS